MHKNNLDLISEIYHIAVFIYDHAGSVLQRFSPNPSSDEILFVVSNCKARLFELCHETKTVHIITSDINQLWAGIPIIEDDLITKMVVLGPVHTSERSKNLAIDHIHSYYFSSRHKDDLLNALMITPVFPYIELAKLISLIYSLIYDEILDDSLLTIAGLSKEKVALADELHTYQESQVPKEDIYQRSFDFEQHFLDCIREGNLERLKRLLKTTTFNVAQIRLHGDLVQQQKYQFVIGLALSIRAAIGGGLNPQVAYSLRDLYVDRVNILQDTPSIFQLHREMLYEITIRVSNHRRVNHYSKVINDCCNYVDEHIRENINVAEVAEHVGFNSHYISTKFKEETGQSIKSYIKQAKISEAKTLLKYSELSISQISELLSFSSQSFFTASFKQVTGLTPGRYRKEVEK